MTVVIAIMLALSTAGILSYQALIDWRIAKSAGIELQGVYSAQRAYLADHPTKEISSIELSNLLPYLSNGNSLPVVQSRDGDDLGIRISVMPPVFHEADGSVYDPSDSNSDGLWDVGPP